MISNNKQNALTLPTMQKQSFPILTTQRLKLNQLLVSDRDALFAIFSDPKVIEHYDVEKFTKIEEADNLVSYFDARFESDTGIRWAIRDNESGTLVGTCGFTHWNQYDHSAVIGYELSPDCWGKGIAFEAVSSIIEFILSEQFHFYVHRIEALALPSNLPSQKLLKKLGFEFEGTLRGKCYWNGDFHDMDMFGLLRKQ
ncbi:GNAT family N-acetyltransferase [Aliiglaciecola sp. LCG003]|uniref:GNAT family N-acetyltransferase n=1 Tax=Aliiglaciecola sp. LCG003 TaxID=3053655 RepID=UPI002572D772|nr:GNAT family N-acetyltransferase [Aliiglaciecola sp. LCG003]WJG08929.1 GNAT family N-acetyltransferase [Aliiglaciecola sp. LCG003]